MVAIVSVVAMVAVVAIVSVVAMVAVVISYGLRIMIYGVSASGIDLKICRGGEIRTPDLVVPNDAR